MLLKLDANVLDELVDSVDELELDELVELAYANSNFMGNGIVHVGGCV